MRKIICLAFLLLFTLCGCVGEEFSDVAICLEESMLITFYEDDGIVHIICSITLQNKTNEDVEAKITGYSQEDVDNGLLLNPNLSCINTKDRSDIFYIKAGQYSEFVVDFFGTYGGILQKKDRLIPDVIELEIIN